MTKLKCSYDVMNKPIYNSSTLELFTKVPGLRKKVESATAKLEDFKTLVRTVARKLNIPCSSITIAPPKSAGTIVTKADRKFNGDISQVLDDNRATIEMKKESDVEKVLALLDKAMKRKLPCLNDVEVKSLKNTFDNAAYQGFEVIKANFILDDVPTEIIFRYPCDEKELKKSHQDYERERAIEGTLRNYFGDTEKNSTTIIQKAEMYPILAKKMAQYARRRNGANSKAFRKN